MNDQPQPTIRSGEDIPHLDGTNDHLWGAREYWNKIVSVARAVLKTRDWQVTENGILVNIAAQAAGGVLDIGEYDPTKKYAPKAIVFFTPEAEAAGAFYSLQAVPPGIPPDTGSPWWADFPTSPPGIFG